MLSLLRRAGSAAPLRRAHALAATAAGMHSAAALRDAAKSGSPATPAAASAAQPHSAHAHHHHATPPAHVSGARKTGNTAADIRRIFIEQQRASLQASEAFPWEVTEARVTAWEPKYEDEKKFHYASRVQEGVHHLTGQTLKRYLDEYGSRYLLSKHALRSGAELQSIRMTTPAALQVEIQANSSILNYWFLALTSGQRPMNTVKSQIESARTKSTAKQVLKVRFSQEKLYDYLVLLHELWPRKDERDIHWKTLPRHEHGQYRLALERVLAEGPSKPLNKATQVRESYMRQEQQRVCAREWRTGVWSARASHLCGRASFRRISVRSLTCVVRSLRSSFSLRVCASAAVQNFIDFLVYQISFHFSESQKQNRNLNWIQFMGVPAIKISKKWGGEIKVPKLRSRDD